MLISLSLLGVKDTVDLEPSKKNNNNNQKRKTRETKTTVKTIGL